jgi:hypothetical protein
MYDLTGVESANRYGRPVGTIKQINQILIQPEAERQVATVVHEATHQIAYNCGMHARYSDCPLWLSEGIAIFFETPDLKSSKGWRGVGAVSWLRLERFRQYLGRRPADSLTTLIADDRRFRDTAHNLDAYAEAWALTYYLIRRYPDEYVEYLKALGKKKPLIDDGPAARLDEFQKAFGDLQRLDAEFLRYMQRVR